MASQLLVSHLFEAAYKATVDGIKTKDFARFDPWIALIPRLSTLCGSTFEVTHASCLDELRKAVTDGAIKAGSYGAFLLTASGLATDTVSLPNATQTARIAALELLYHTYFHSTKGQEAVWVVSIPVSYSTWPHLQLTGATVANILSNLNAGGAERFSITDRKHIASAAQTGLAWTHKALLVLDDLSSGSNALFLLRYWFGNRITTDEELIGFAEKMRAGLRKIASKLNGGTAVVTDFVPIRTSSDPNDLGMRRANAFVVGIESQDVIYIEEGFFSANAGNVFQNDARHWARIMVHEMTHREAATVDKRYGWAGIAPSTGKISPADAMVNADNWAIFVADAAGAMTATDIARATNGI
ncbi:MAG: M35 family metallo-endopeptidase [Gammaproteobacteria bacterium]